MATFHHFRRILILLILCTLNSLTKCDDARALLDIKQQLNDPMNHLESWNESNSVSEFFGVSVNSDYRVTDIMLFKMSLSGTISPSVSSLTSLRTLHLGTNKLSGTIPQELVKLIHLRSLNLSVNTLTGDLPDFSSLRNLQFLEVSQNLLTGKFPAWLGELTGLVWLGLAHNSFDSGDVPVNIGNLKNLTYLYLAECNLVGEIPDSFSGLESLGTFDLSMNQMTGAFPKWIPSLRNLWKIELYANNLTGELPFELTSLTTLQEFDVSRNFLTGRIAPEFGNLRNLTVFQIYENSFYGEFPQGFGEMENLRTLSIYRNEFSGEFPANIGRYSPLNGIDISENKFSGPFPKFMCENRNLEYLLVLTNNFSGEFPDYSECKTLLRFRISDNNFVGNFPDGLWGLPNVDVFDVSDNAFTGTISPGIGISTSLTQLYMQNNYFTGAIPAEISSLSQLQKLVASNNSLSGSLPIQLGALSQLTSLHLENNALSGSIPPEIKMCANLVDVSLASNSLTGEIPQELSLLSSLNSLNLSSNLLTGSIPEGLQYLKLSSVDFSDNKLSGEIPSGLLVIAGDSAFSGNPDLCIIENSDKTYGQNISICRINPYHKEISKRRMVLILAIMLVLFAIFSVLVYISYKSCQHEESCKRADTKVDVSDEWKLESFHPTELDVEEISNIDEDNLIGTGGSGKVYKLELTKNRGVFAVKKLYYTGKKTSVSEISILGKIRHRNVLKLYACLLKGDASYLVFEYMENGNLFDALRGVKVVMDWERRYGIALGAAKGIMYLHHDCSPPIVHRDIKSMNILLNEEYEAKIADFGIAKVAEGSENSCFAGTHGYMAPELAYSQKLSEKSDVYSYGVVLLELITGRNPAEPQFGEGKDIVYWVSSNLYKQNAEELLDARIRENSAEDMTKVLRIALLCTTKLPSLRPSMREVVNMLADADPYGGGAASRFKSVVKE